jgi:hypothetical protein
MIHVLRDVLESTMHCSGRQDLSAVIHVNAGTSRREPARCQNPHVARWTWFARFLIDSRAPPLCDDCMRVGLRAENARTIRLAIGHYL